MNDLSAAQLERLALLSEECGEVLQVVGKILRHGWQVHGHENRIALEHELGDLRWAIQMLIAADDVWDSTIARFAAEKTPKALPYLHHQPIQVTSAAWSVLCDEQYVEVPR
jgi:NTP pyrophosphatase (non-canonical NTP hydrolase)